VLKLGGRAGEVVWRRMLRGTGRGNDGCDAVAIDRSGDVVAVGRTVNRETQNNFTVIKLDGTTGHGIWRRIVVGSTRRQRARARAVVIAPSGKIIAAGSVSNRRSGVDVALVKLAASGLGRWKRMIHGTAHESLRDPPYPGEGVWGLAVDPRGDIVAAGALLDTAPGGMSFMMTKLARETGRVHWRRVFGGGGGTSLAHAVAIAPGGKVVAAGTLVTSASSDFAVVQLDGTSGELAP
jgi:hypothetical protein